MSRSNGQAEWEAKICQRGTRYKQPDCICFSAINIIHQISWKLVRRLIPLLYIWNLQHFFCKHRILSSFQNNCFLALPFFPYYHCVRYHFTTLGILLCSPVEGASQHVNFFVFFPPFECNFWVSFYLLLQMDNCILIVIDLMQ